ncbi:amino acid adenylation domain-containing protein [Mucilaginibacter sp. 21P]|uniref:non-ribosomal peptide synthetase n=1 Tax=Mucilaginibacter sp. 21P TaxID=2778902 RepID=UPI001C568918|nr:non-ribosomal peptide synthetase [Mucilaginibacter sp. 21P]QXV63861.1 amino acid adenylation domain-containing protein [Mucilaginibacter sp. 21P]
MNTKLNQHSTLLTALSNSKNNNKRGVTFIQGSNADNTLSYSDLYNRSVAFLGVLQAIGLKPGDELIIQLDDNQQFLIAFWGSLMGKIIPVPLSMGGQDDHKNKLVQVWKQMHNPYLVCDDVHLKRIEEYCDAQGFIEITIQLSRRHIGIDKLTDLQYPALLENIMPDDIAYIQYSSGSTGTPKGVVLTHSNLLTNVTDIVSRSGITAADAMLSWMPLTHDMGLICFHFSGVLAGINQYVIPTALFIRNPILWIERASQHKATLLYSPNFGYQYFYTAASAVNNGFDWDLSRVRLIYNGAEPISVEISEQFLNFLGKYGLNSNVMYPGYGLAEACVAVTLPTPGDKLNVHNIKRASLKTGEQVTYTNIADDSIGFVEVGHPMEHCAVRICNDENLVLGDGHIGNIQIKGGNVSTGYYRQTERTNGIILADGWLSTQDVGFFSDGKLVITGRKKNIIIINGQNYYPHDIEMVIYKAINSEIGKVVVCGLRSVNQAKENLIVFILHKGTVENFIPIVAKTKAAIAKSIGIVADLVIPVRRIPKTTSGKVQNYKLLELYADGEFDKQIAEITHYAQLNTQLDDVLAPGGDTVITGLIKIVKELSGNAGIVANDNLFALGINSLQAVKLTLQIADKFKVDISLQDIFDHPVIWQLANVIANKPQAQNWHISRAPENEFYDLSYGQSHLWALHEFLNFGSALNISVAKNIAGRIDKAVLNRALETMVSRHEVLRTVFTNVDGTPKQKILNNGYHKPAVKFIELLNENSSASTIKKIIEAEGDIIFSLTEGPLFNLSIVQYTKDEYVFIFTIHHIVADGWSVVNFINELFVIYQSFVKGTKLAMPVHAYQHKDYTYWCNRQLAQGKWDGALSYWKKIFKNDIVPVELPYKTGALLNRSVKGAEFQYEFSPTVAQQIEEICGRKQVTPFMMLLSVVKLLLHKYSNQTDITIGTDIAGRNTLELESQLGYFLNMLPIRTDLSGISTFDDLLKQVKENTVNAYLNQHYPAFKAISSLRPGKDVNDIYNVLVIFQNFDTHIDAGGDLTLTDYQLTTNTALTDLHFEFLGEPGKLTLNLKYNTDAFDAWQISNLLNHFALLVQMVLDAPDNALTAFDPFRHDKHKLLAYNHARAYSEKNVIDLLSRSLNVNQSSIAIICGDSRLTYQQLNEQINQVAAAISSCLNDAEKAVVGISLARSEKQVITLLAILRAGYTYVFIDPEYPKERMDFIAADSEIKLLITDSLPNHNAGASVVLYRDLLVSSKAIKRSVIIERDDLAYIMYTSGSTGVPKGVMISHAALYDYVKTFSYYFGVDQDDVMIQQSSLAFDVSVEEIFPVLCAGGKLVISDGGGRDTEGLIANIQNHRATLLTTTPLVIAELNKQAGKLSSLRVLISGGDRLNRNHIDRLFSVTQIYNTYGPTETTVCATYNKIDNLNETAIVGRPIPNRQVYILNENQQLVAPGVKGEIYIGGAGLAQGYKNLQGETSSNFVPSPFHPSERLFRSGDYGRWLENGKIEILGRKDDQIKINGYRIELSEVLRALLQVNGVADAFVTTKNDESTGKQLVAWFVTASGSLLNAELLRAKLNNILPIYMVPTFLIAVATIPQTVNGKVDSGALPMPSCIPDKLQSYGVVTKIERDIAAIWADTLQFHGSFKNYNFFESGGNSIKATVLAAALQKAYGLKISFADIFANPTIASLANLVTSRGKAQTNIPWVIEEAEYYDLSNGQKRLWLLDQFQNSGNAYSLQFAFKFKGDVDFLAFEKSFNLLIDRHGSLRTIFKLVNNEPRQFVYAPGVIKYVNGYDHVSDEEGHSVDEIAEKFFSSPFDVTSWPLFRAGFIKLNSRECVFLLKIHHIIADGWSVEVLARELALAYNQFKSAKPSQLDPVQFQYKDYAAWQQKEFLSEGYDQAKRYWLNKFEEIPQPLDLPADYSRIGLTSFEGDKLSFKLDADLKKRLADLGADSGTSLFVVLLSVVKGLFYRYTGSTDITIGVPVSGRGQNEFKDMVGFFLNTVPLRTSFSEDDTFLALLNNVKETAINGFKYQDYPYDQIVEALNITGKNVDLFNVMVGFQNKENGVKLFSNLNGIDVSLHPLNATTSQFDLSVDFFDTTEGIYVEIEFSTNLFKRSRIERLAHHIVRFADVIANQPETIIQQVDYLGQDEKYRITSLFNQTTTNWNDARTFQQIFEDAVAQNSSANAVKYNSKVLNYADLNAQANQLAHYLRGNFGVRVADKVGLLVERSEMMLVYVMGIIKAGAVFVPIDTQFPTERVNAVVEDSGLKVLLTDRPINFSNDINFTTVINLREIASQVKLCLASNPENLNQVTDALYIIYTSGSTGKPKGMAIAHHNVTNVYHSWREIYQLNAGTKLLQIASIAFDVFIGDLCRALLNGGEMVICPADMRVDPEALYNLITKHGITILESTPSLIIPFTNYIIENGLQLSILKVLILGSETCLLQDYHKLLKYFGDQLRIINSYGTTETTIDASYFEEKHEANLPETSTTPIGKPMHNMRFYVLDRRKQLVPVGVDGELYIGGTGVGMGYVNRNDLNAEKFISHPVDPNRLYKTGDMARWLEDGNVLYKGRGDFQVKIRGHRIELGEIENVLLGYAGVQDVQVLARGDDEESYLVAYVIMGEGSSTKALRAWLLNRLPHYMVPSYIVSLPVFPTTPSGKVDVKSLPLPERGSRDENYAAAETPLQASLVRIWQEVLEADCVGIRDNFFEIGGHSLKAVKVASGIYRELHLRTELRNIFTYPTIEQLSGLLEQVSRIGYQNIQPVASASSYPLSHAQKRLWLLEQLGNAGTAYHMPSGYYFNGGLDLEVLEKALVRLISRHEILRTRFITVDGEPRQQVQPAPDFKITYHDLKNTPETLTAMLEEPEEFDLSCGPLLSCRVLELEKERYIVLFNIHHIIGDGWSSEVMIREVQELYEAQQSGREADLPILRIQYRDYAHWQHEQLSSGVLSESRAYWYERLSGRSEPLDLATDYARPAEKTYNGRTHRIMMPPALYDRLKHAGREHQASMFMLLVSLLNTLLSRYTGQEEITIGIPVAGRNHPDLENQVGFYVNTLGIRSRLDKQSSFTALTAHVKEQMLGAYSHQDYPFDLLLEELDVVWDQSRSPLFDVMAVLQETEVSGKLEGLRGLKVSSLETADKISKFDLTFSFTPSGETLELAIEYNTDLFSAPRIGRMADHYLALAYAALSDPEQPIGRLNYLPAAEAAKLSAGYHDKISYPADKTLQELFEMQALARPEATALVYGSTRLSYGELNRKANQLAHYLRTECGVRADEPVGLRVSRSEWMVIGMLGILKSGGAYVPIDVEYPAERVSYIQEDASLNIILTDEDTEEAASGLHNLRNIRLESQPAGNPAQVNIPSDAAYVIYTSGSSGKPKGVVVEHRNVVSLLFAEGFGFSFGQDEIWTVFHSMCFDFSVWEIYGALLNGGVLVVVPREATLNLSSYIDLLEQEGVTVLNQVPTVFKNLVGELYQRAELPQLKLRYVLFGGEALNFASLRDWQRHYPNVRLINLYGITETTVVVTYKEIIQADIERGFCNIGVPLSSLRLYLADSDQQLVAEGVAGELLIGGAGVARGYLNRPELTLSRFIDSPFRRGERLYRSGDLGVRQDNGDIVYKGRGDFQVKIRGHRIELGEIENVLLGYAGVQDVQVLARGDDGESYLVAYVIMGEGSSTKALRAWLLNRLPHYMVPSYIVSLPVFPTTPSGKVDVKSLPLPERGSRDENYAAAETPLQASLVRIWQEVLEADCVGIRDNFFEIGGHSLKAVKVASGIYRELHLRTELRNIFTYPTIEQLSGLLEQVSRIGYQNIQPVASASSYPLSHAQKRLWLLEQLGNAGTAYHMPSGYYFNGGLDLEVLEKALVRLISRHEILRTRFITVDGEPRQQVQPAPDFKITYHDLKNTPETLTAMLEEPEEFDLSCGPLLSCRVLELEKERYIVLFNIHHIIGDGWSSEVMIREVQELYEAQQSGREADLPILRIQYRDYAHWQHEQLSSGVLSESRAYWYERLSGRSEPLDLATDYARPAEKTYNGRTHRIMMPPALYDRLKHAGREHQASMFMLLVSLLNTLLSRYTGQEEITIGIPVAGRNHPDLENQVGFYVNTLGIRSRLDKQSSFTALTAHVKEQMLGAYSHQDYPFDLLLEELDVVWDQSRSPLFDVMAVLQETEVSGKLEGLRGLKVSSLETADKISKFDLTFSFTPSGETLELAIEYNTDLFSAPRIGRMADHYLALAYAALSDPEQPIGRLNYLPAAEAAKLSAGYHDKISYPADKTLQELFEMQALARPEATALVYGSTRLSYGELNRKANQLAHYLRTECGVRADEPVGLRVSRSEWMVIGMLGILKSGGAYVPIDVEYPAERVSYIQEDASLNIILTDEDTEEAASGLHNLRNIRLESQPAGNPAQVNIPSDAAYVIYTSGSSGKPKGVVVEHRNVVSLLFAEGFGFSFGQDEIWTVFHSMCFDFSVWEIYGALLNGGVLVVVPREATLNLSSYIDLLEQEGVTVLNQVPTVFKNLVGELYQRAELPQLKLRYVLFGGEALNFASLRDWQRHYPNVRLINLYGITETTVVVTYKEIIQADIERGFCNIGVPLSSLRLYLADSDQQLVAEGVAGELLIGGAGVARGYLNRPELTLSRFIDSPFRRGERLYRSGDLGVRQDNGDIVYKGRGDFQVKIRGHRIELGEIENVLLGYAGVQDVQVLARGDDGESYLVAYVIMGEGSSTKALRAWLLNRLPHYMVPSYIVSLPVFPTTPSGKVDVKSLPLPERGSRDENYAAAETPLQASLVRIWQEVLEADCVGIRDNFFEIGGHSLKAVKLNSLIYRELQVKLDLNLLFINPTIEQQADVIDNSTETKFEPIPVIANSEYYEASPSQKRLWITDHYQEDKRAYIIPLAKIIEGPFNHNAFIKALQYLLNRHESLRTTFLLADGKVIQKVHRADNFHFNYQYEDLTGRADIDKAIENYSQHELTEAFDLEKGPLLRARICRLDDDQHLLLLSMHHIICDGWSISIISDELFKLYYAFHLNLKPQLPELRIQYRDYAAWHNSKLNSNEVDAVKNYWLKKLAGNIELLDLPADHPRSVVRTNNGRTISIEFTDDERDALRQLTKQHQVSLFVTAMSAVKVLLYRYTYQTDIVVGSPVAGREHSDLHDQVGFYVNTLVLRDFIYGDDNFRGVVKKVNKTCIDGFANQLYPFELLVDDLPVKRNGGKSSLFNVMVMLQNNKDAQVSYGDLNIRDYENQLHNTSKFDILFNFYEKEDAIRLEIEYNSDYFFSDRIFRLIDNLKMLIRSITDNPEQPIGELSIFETDKTVVDFL